MKISKIQIFVTIFIIAIAVLCLYVALHEKLIVEKNHFISNFSSFKMQSDDISCGPACVSMVLDYYSVFHVYDEIRRETKTEWFVYKNEKYGMTIPKNIVSTLKKHHIPCSVFRGNLQLLEDNISRNKPVICLVRSGRYTWHYVVVIGFSPNNIYIGNPSNGLFTVYLTENKSGVVNVIDLTGKLIYSSTCNPGINSVDLNNINLSKGVYFIFVLDNMKTITFRMIIFLVMGVIF